MCERCWQGFGSPELDTPAVRQTSAQWWTLSSAYLQTLMEDWPIEDSQLAVDLQSPRRIPDDREFIIALLAMTLPERASVLAVICGFWELPDERPRMH